MPGINLLDVSISDTTTRQSAAYDMPPSKRAGMQLYTDGTLQGSWKVRATANSKYKTPHFADVTAGVTSGTFAAAVTGPGDQWIELSEITADQVLVEFVPTSGSGNARVDVTQ